MHRLSRTKLAQSIRAGSAALLVCASGQGWAYELYNQGDTQINADLEAMVGLFHSGENYGQSGTLAEGSSSWQEAYLKYGFSFSQGLSGSGDQAYGALNWVSSGTFGDGDAAGWSNGSERTTKVEDAYLGWRSGNRFAALGENGVDVSFGRQNIVIGDGFLVSGDALNFGREVADGMLDRGGAYYITPRKAFDKTAVLRLGGEQGLRGDLMWLKSDNRSQGRPEMAVATLENVTDKGTVGLTYLDVLDTDEEFDFVDRKGIRTYSLRAQGNAGVENLFLSGEYAHQDKNDGNENAWYLEAGWTFSDIAWSPSVNYRYSRFSNAYDPLFYGNGRALGTWFQGEVASNYAGPFNSNTRVHHIGLKAAPAENLTVGALMYRFETIDSNAGAFADLGGKEIDLYAEWAARDNLFIIPVVGFYKPNESLANGGSQIGNDDTNLYGQLLVVTMF
ncbi:hypothetical protein [Pseudomonas sp. YJ42]|uniref:hypothetical protein n=1 Tax=Pseudomonas sp. YJ42 TaxID=3392115 RepID=UPI00399F8F77